MSLELAIAENTRALQALLAHLQVGATIQAAPAVESAPKARKAKAEPAPVVEAEHPAGPYAKFITEPVVEKAPAPAIIVTRDDLLAVMAKAIRAGKRDEVKALLAKAGAAKVSEVPEDRIADVAAAVTALLGE
ncbi:hypothetical protein UFOVP821_16 [uncultured Caudovirales phage]|uniref:Uncharacterized protein n=1 Tax=uncultured Caudovirales phage TaxID=2100421 RepID=A0A6J5P1E2_9CAUD|nr:hypothetical protein UFOVP821_16 [uncultured Caudovirales phage]